MPRLQFLLAIFCHYPRDLENKAVVVKAEKIGEETPEEYLTYNH